MQARLLVPACRVEQVVQVWHLAVEAKALSLSRTPEPNYANANAPVYVG
jgi:hypothetical protein